MTRWIIKEDEGLDAAGKPVRGLPHAATADAAVRNDDMLAAIAGVSPSVTNSTALVGTNAGDGSIRFVSSYRDLFRLDKTTPRTAIPDVILQSTIDPTWFWVRLHIPDPFWRTQGFVTINPRTGNNENAGFGSSMGAADGVALLSFAELNRRLPDTGYPDDLVIHVTDSIPDDQEDDMILTRLRVQSYDTKIIIYCEPTSAVRPAIYTGTVAAYTLPAVSSTNTDRHLTLAGATGAIVGRMIQKTDGSKTAFVLGDRGSNVYRISRPRTANSLTGALGAPTEFANGDAVRVLDAVTMPISPLPATAFTRDLTNSGGNLILSNAYLRSLSSGVLEIDNGGASPRYVNCIINDSTILGGINASWANILMTSTTVGLNFMGAVRFLSIYGLAFLGTQLLMEDSSIRILESFDVEGQSSQTAFATLHMQRGHCSITFEGAEIGLFNCSQGLAHSDIPPGSVVMSAASLYGAGNSNAILSPSSGCHWLLVSTGLFATTSAAHPISIKGVGYDYADLPISLLASHVMVAVS